MDAFYASVEQRDNPTLRGIPRTVGGSRERGVVAAASYEARRFGVRSAMLGIVARWKCPELVFVRPRFDVYKAVSQQIRAVFAEYITIIEPLSLDKAYLEVTENLQGIATATQIAQAIRASIRERTGLTASAGVSYNKFLAKLASDHLGLQARLHILSTDHGFNAGQLAIRLIIANWRALIRKAIYVRDRQQASRNRQQRRQSSLTSSRLQSSCGRRYVLNILSVRIINTADNYPYRD